MESELGLEIIYANHPTAKQLTTMMVWRMTAFKTQHRWLENHPDEAEQLSFRQVSHRTTLSRRFKSLYPTLQGLIAFIGVWASALSPEFDSCALIEDSSLFKAHGPVWHQSDRNAGRIPGELPPPEAGGSSHLVMLELRQVIFVLGEEFVRHLSDFG